MHLNSEVTGRVVGFIRDNLSASNRLLTRHRTSRLSVKTSLARLLPAASTIISATIC